MAMVMDLILLGHFIIPVFSGREYTFFYNALSMNVTGLDDRKNDISQIFFIPLELPEQQSNNNYEIS